MPHKNSIRSTSLNFLTGQLQFVPVFDYTSETWIEHLRWRLVAGSSDSSDSSDSSEQILYIKQYLDLGDDRKTKQRWSWGHDR